MNILFYFLDMLPGNVVADTVENNDNPYLANFLKDFRGTLYTNTYTPAPDTPRSLACLISASSPKDNGCSIREFWPGHFMTLDETNQLLHLQNQGFQIFTLLTETEMLTQRFLPNLDKLEFKNYQNLASLNSAILSSNTSKDTFIFVQDNVFHNEVDERYGHKSSIRSGLKKSIKNLNNFFKVMSKDEFDLIVLFSDHGFKPNNYSKSKSNHLDDIRIKIFLNIRSKNDPNLLMDKKLRSISDIFPLVFEKLNIRTTLQTDHLVNGREYLVVEDHGSLGPNVSGRPNHWKIIFKSGTYTHVWQEGNQLFFVDSVSSSPLPIEHLDQDFLNILIEETVFFKSSYFNSKSGNSVVSYKKFIKGSVFRILNLIS